VKLIQLL